MTIKGRIKNKITTRNKENVLSTKQQKQEMGKKKQENNNTIKNKNKEMTKTNKLSFI